MNALEFFASASWDVGTTDFGGEITVLLPCRGKEMVYLNMAEGYYEYLLLTPREGETGEHFYRSMKEILGLYFMEEQFWFLKKMESIEIDFHMEVDGIGMIAADSSLLFSVRGTCGLEKTCKNCGVCKEIYFEPCCRGNVVGFSKVACAQNPAYGEILMDLVLWMTHCPNLEAVYIIHSFSPYNGDCSILNYECAFLIKEGRITFVEDKKEVERLYLEYDEKYPCGTKEM